MGYTHTFIAVAEDCGAATGEVPPLRAGALTVAGLQHAMLIAQPGRLQQEDVLLACAPGIRGRSDLTEEELVRLRRECFAQPRACLRASPLPKSYGWGLHYDDQGRITLHAVDSGEYLRLSKEPSLTQLRAMRSRRLQQRLISQPRQLAVARRRRSSRGALDEHREETHMDQPFLVWVQPRHDRSCGW